MKKAVKPKIGAFKVGSEKPKLLVGENPRRKALRVYNKGDIEVELVSSKDSRFGDGIPVLRTLPYINEGFCQGAYWIVAESGTQTVAFEEDVIDE